MMMSSAATREMRVLSDVEIALVAGGPLNDLVDTSHMTPLTPDGVFIMSNGMIFADYDSDGNYDMGWRAGSACPTGWEQSTTGDSWSCGSSGMQAFLDWLENHPSWHIVEG